MPDDTTLDATQTALLLVVGVGLLALGVGNLVDLIDWRLPGWAYLLIGVALLVYGVVSASRDRSQEPTA